MEVFLIWSGAVGGESHELAKTLKTFLEHMLPVTCHLSTHMEPGIDWQPDLEAKLRSSSVGVYCAAGAMNARWPFYEVGVMKGLGVPVCPIVMPGYDLEGPLRSMRRSDTLRDQVLDVLRAVRSKLPDEEARKLRGDGLRDFMARHEDLLEELPLEPMLPTDATDSTNEFAVLVAGLERALAQQWTGPVELQGEIKNLIEQAKSGLNLRDA